MDVATFWNRSGRRWDWTNPRPPGLWPGRSRFIVVLLTVGIAHWTGGWVRRAAMAGRVYAEVATLLSRATALAVYAIEQPWSWRSLAPVGPPSPPSSALPLSASASPFRMSAADSLTASTFSSSDPSGLETMFVSAQAEGRVEEVGVRLTTLRTAAGERIIVPNTVVFSSIIENSSVGMVDRQKYVVTGIERPASEIQAAVIAALRGTPHLSHHAPVVEAIRSSPDGTDAEVTVEHDHGVLIDDQVIERLRSLFRKATVATKSPIGVL